MKTFSANNLLRMTLSVSTNPAGVLIDPDTLALTLRYPDLSVHDITGSIVVDGVGQYHADQTLTVPGIYTYEWTGSGGVTVQTSLSFQVVGAPF